jgi:gliding motility-associated-like protein
MKKQFLNIVLLLFCSQMLLGQDVPSVVRLNSGTFVTNAIIYENSGHKPLSDGVSGNYSASDSIISGANNIILTENPFVNLFRIDASSPAFNSGTTDGLRVSDTLDLDNKPRLSCCGMDIGAFEFFDFPTKTTQQPKNIRTVVGALPVFLAVSAEGTDLSYQWQYNGIDLPNKISDRLQFDGIWADTGVYRAIVYGVCCNDTSLEVRVNYDDWRFESGGECPQEESWARILVAENGYKFLWATNSETNEIRGFQSGQYWVTITDSENRTLTLDPVFYSFLPIEIDFSIFLPDIETCDNGSIAIDVLNENDYDFVFQWLHNGDYFSSEKNLNSAPYGTYKLFVEREFERACLFDTFNFTLRCQYKFALESTVITPNGDGINDILNIKYIEHFQNNTVTIINSYGEIIFQKDHYDNVNVFWDGRNKNGQPVPDGTYYFVVQADGRDVMANWVIKKTAK